MTFHDSDGNPIRHTAENKVTRLAMHLTLAAHLIQRGLSVRELKLLCTNMLSMVKDVANDDSIDDDWHVQVAQPLPEQMADMLAQDVEVPDDISGLEGGTA